MWINIKTEFSFREVYGPIRKIIEKLANTGCKTAGIADMNNTFGFVNWEKECQRTKIKPIYGVKLAVCNNIPVIRKNKDRRYRFDYMTFVAQNIQGFQELNELVFVAQKQFYWRPLIEYLQLNKLSKNIHIICGFSPQKELIERFVFQEIGPHTFVKNIYPPIACINNYYVNAQDRYVYEPFSSERLRAAQTYPIHILSEKEWLQACNHKKHKALRNLKKLSYMIESFNLPIAPMIKFYDNPNRSLSQLVELCKIGAKAKNIDIIKDSLYMERYHKELNLINKKEYIDYFLIVADLVEYAKKKMIVGPARGSAAGSLICYLLGITEIDPLKYGLLFERFIDINRHDLPDIDVDFQDDKRNLILKYLQKKYGENNVALIANISRLKPKSAITKFRKAFAIPEHEAKEFKDSIEEDKNNYNCIQKNINSKISETFLKKYPQMRVVEHIENHADHVSQHAAGIIVSEEKITNFCAIQIKDKKHNIIMADKKGAERLGLLKIDALGLKTLTILNSICEQIEVPYTELYDIPLSDRKTYELLNNGDLFGVFQFEGSTIQNLSRKISINNIEDIAALSAIGRPGPLSSGGAYEYLSNKSLNTPKYIINHDIFKKITFETFGVIVYQEQIMGLLRELGGLSWHDTSDARKAISKSKGIEYMEKFKTGFVKGCIENGLLENEGLSIWEYIEKMGKYSFNKSHAISYAILTYLTAYFKANYQLEFTLACLKNSKNDKSVRILRNAVENGIEYEHFNFQRSQENWSIQNNKLYGGFVNLHGIGPATAKKAVKLRNNNEVMPAGIQKHINNEISPFKYIYPATQIYGNYYINPEEHSVNGKIHTIKELKKNGKYVILGCLIQKKPKQDGSLNIILQDDTGEIIAKISKRNYQIFGSPIAENGKIDTDWYMVYGEKINNWQILFVKNIKKITKKGYEE